MQPEAALYGGGIINDQASGVEGSLGNSATTSSGVYSPSFILHNLSQGTIYCFSSWVLYFLILFFSADSGNLVENYFFFFWLWKNKNYI